MTVKVANGLLQVRDEDQISVNVNEPFQSASIVNCEARNLKGLEDLDITKSLQLTGCLELISLEGAPRVLDGYFRVTRCALESLEHCPAKIGGEFSINNTPIKNWDYFPAYVGGNMALFVGSVHLKVLRKLKYFGGAIITVSGQVTGGYLNLFKIEMPNFKSFILSPLDREKDPIFRELDKLLIRANADRSQVNSLMLEAQDLLIDAGLAELATL